MPSCFIVTNSDNPLLLPNSAVLHVVGGTLPDRVTPIRDHYTLVVRMPYQQSSEVLKFAQQKWTKLAPIPLGTGHASAILHKGLLYVLGGSRGHRGVSAQPPACKDDHETVDREFGYVLLGTYVATLSGFSFNLTSSEWKRLPDLPTGTSHNEASTLIHPRGHLMVVGGMSTNERNLPTIIEYFPDLNRWHMNSIPLLEPRKGAGVWIHDGKIYVSAGQKPHPDDPKQHSWLVRDDTFVASIS